MPASRRSEWEHLLAMAGQSNAPRTAPGARSIASPDATTSPEDENRAAAREQATRDHRLKLGTFLDKGHGECYLRDPHIAELTEHTLRFHHSQRFQLLAWVVMPNHVHALLEIAETPLSKIIQNWKSTIAVAANRHLGRSGEF